MTLYTALVTVSKVAAPMIPFMTDEIYRNLVCSVDKTAPISVHLCDFPVANESYIDSKLEERMEDVLDIVVLGRACRNTAQIKNRQPIAKMYIKADYTLPEYFTDIIADELNVKSVEFANDVSAFTTYSFKPQLRTVGPKYGKYLGKIRELLSSVNGNAAMAELKANGVLVLDLGDAKAELTEEDLLIESAQKPGLLQIPITALQSFSIQTSRRSSLKKAICVNLFQKFKQCVRKAALRLWIISVFTFPAVKS